MARFIGKTARTRFFVALMVVSFCIGMGPFQFVPAQAAELTPRSLTLSGAYSATSNVTYRVTFGIPVTTMVGSVRLQLCSNTSLVDDSCIAPFGLDAINVNLDSQSGVSGFSYSPSDSTVNEIVLTRPPALQSNTMAQFTFTNIRNPSNAGSYYARIFTYASSNGTGPYTDAGGLAFVILPSLSVSTEVPPYLRFCLGESITNFDCTTTTEPFADLGNLTPTTTGAAQSQMVVATNAGNGYSMWVLGDSMTSGNNVITPMPGGAALKGTAQFGLNLRANANPPIGQDPLGPGSGGVAAGYNQPNLFRFNSGDTLASSPNPDDNRKYTVSYIVNVPATQPGGVYSTTLTYVCLANF
jgi:hypothetical protein